MEQITSEEVLASLSAIVSRIEQLEPMTTVAAAGPNAAATFVDILDEEVARASAQGVEIDTALRNGVTAMLYLGQRISTQELESLGALLRSDVLHPRAVEAVGRMGRALVYRAALAAFFGGSGAEATMEASVKAGEASFSRDQERESDEFGMKLVFAAYGRVDGSLEFFKKMQGQATDSKLNLFASHPLTAERLEDLKKLQASYKGVTKADEK